MGTLAFEIIMTLAGLIILIMKKVQVGRMRRTGWQATAIGLSLLLPLPLVLLMGVVMSVLITTGAASLAIVEVGNSAELGLVLGGLAAAVVFFSLPVRNMGA